MVVFTKIALACLLLLARTSSAQDAGARSFVIQNDALVRDGQPVNVMSGSFHYSRTPPGLWRDRLQRLRAMGLNTVQTYVPWNFHEENSNDFNFAGDRNITRFILTAQEEGLMVLVRMGPYMCGEWEFGGFPAWLLNVEPPVTIRTYEPGYIAAVDRYWAQLLPLLKPLLWSNGGPVVMVQVENEYGSYGNVGTHPSDLKYMEHLVQLTHTHLGEGSVIVYTTDGGNTGYMSRGALKGNSTYTVGDHGPGSDTGNCAAMAQYNPPGMNPCMDSEYYTGWLTHWGENMANTSAAGAAKPLDTYLAANTSFNLYMGFGGTNFGWWSGANGGGKSYQPHITSYDYDSPVDEGGAHGYGGDGDKWQKIRDVLAKYQGGRGGFPAGTAPPAEPPLTPRKAYASVTLGESAPMLSATSLAVLTTASRAASDVPPSMESLGQNYGFVLYEATTPAGVAGNQTLGFSAYPRDRCHAFVGGVPAIDAPLFRPVAPASVPLAAAAAGGETLTLLLENMGRLNYGGGMTDPKGMWSAKGEAVLYNGKNLTGPGLWRTRSLPLQYAQLQKLAFTPNDGPRAAGAAAFTPTFFRGTLQISDAAGPADTYVKMGGWGKGIVWVNGYNLGRYWEAEGPQHNLYLPAPLLRSGANELLLLELDAPQQGRTLSFDVKPDFSGKPAAPCSSNPKAGTVLQMRECDSALAAQQQWDFDSSGRLLLSSTAAHGAGGALAARAADAGLCVTIGPGKDPTYGFPLAQLEPCSAAADQQLAPTTDANSFIRNKAQDMCLDVSNHDKAEGAPVGFYHCTVGANEAFTVQDTPAHHVELVVKETGKCVTAC